MISSTHDEQILTITRTHLSKKPQDKGNRCFLSLFFVSEAVCLTLYGFTGFGLTKDILYKQDLTSRVIGISILLLAQISCRIWIEKNEKYNLAERMIQTIPCSALAGASIGTMIAKRDWMLMIIVLVTVALMGLQWFRKIVKTHFLDER